MATEIYGIIDSCFGGYYAIRGFANVIDIINYSEPIYEYQRTPNDEHTAQIREFFSSGKNLFTPEVILSYNNADWYSKEINDVFASGHTHGGYVSPLGLLLNGFAGNGFVVPRGTRVVMTDRFGLKFHRIVSNNANLPMVKIVFPAAYSLKPFHRIDGNHRLEALSTLQSKATYKIPFSILLLSDDYSLSDNKNTNARVEMEIFHNINSKVQPLTSAEQYKGLFELFSTDELKKFGEEFSITKSFTEKHGNMVIRNIAPYFEEKKDMVSFCVKFIFDRDGKWISEDELFEIFTVLNSTYFENYPLLRDFKNKFTLIPYVYYLYQGQSKVNPKLDAYNTWFIKNKLYEMKDLDPASMIAAFDSIYQIRQKQIFVAMPFEERLDFVFDAICEVVERINDDNNIELPAPIRIDKQIVGFSYDIVNEILDKIENCGLLIADLTGQNANVYYEAGFAQGLIRAKLGNTAQVLYLISDSQKPDQPLDTAKFDVNHFKILSYKDQGKGHNDLKTSIEVELRAFYGI